MGLPTGPAGCPAWLGGGVRQGGDELLVGRAGAGVGQQGVDVALGGLVVHGGDVDAVEVGGEQPRG